jgi:LETM1 and EF-hand domain-containing protein 1
LFEDYLAFTKMASRAILRRRRNSINQYFNASASSISSFHSPLRSFATKPHTSQSNGCDETSRYKDELLFNSPVLRNYVRRFTTANFKNDFTRSNVLNESIGVRWLSQSSSAAATAKNDEPESDDLVAKKRKEASPEECDQAVEGLTTAKAKAMAKRLQEPQKDVQSVFQRVWATFLGIGPALRAVASMSRLVTPFPPFHVLCLVIYITCFNLFFDSIYGFKLKLLL